MKLAILLVDHGSRREHANVLLEEVAALLRKRSDGIAVHTAHMELSPPNIQEGFDACIADGADEIVVHPFFLGPGRHTTQDIPLLVTEAAARHPRVRVRVSEPLGSHSGVIDAILARIQEVQS